MPSGWPAGADELGKVGGDGSGAGAPALGDGAVVLGSLAVPTRVMCEDGLLATVLVRGELANRLDLAAGLGRWLLMEGSSPFEPGTVSGRIPARL